MVISSSIAVSIGYTVGKKNTQQEANNRIPIAHFSEQQVNDFLRSYFTFTEYGDNYLNYEKFLAKQAKIAEEESRKQRLRNSPALHEDGGMVHGTRKPVPCI